jgi:iron complex transport system substrate-binding protein
MSKRLCLANWSCAWALVGMAFAAAVSTVAAADTVLPSRVVSFNLCADQLVVGLAERSQIAGLSAFAADAELSVVADAARGFPRLDQRSEATVALQPDLVLVGPNDRTAMRRTLTELGLRVHEVGLVTDVAGARAQVREMAALLGQRERGEALVGAIDAAQGRLAAAAPRRGATALVVERGGYVGGPNSLVAALLREAGLQPPPGGPQGFGGYVSLEHLLVLRPDVLVMHGAVTEAPDQGSLFLVHPALKERYPPARRLILPRRFALCGGPALVAALDYLTAALSQSNPR